ncbi:class III extradiol ring-cleavage dioxygenase [Hyphobacterium sp. HN65]|uniref:Class III extradiol ring-cleavage dioxygenase n=1 Tax=Hyphobacterium lacteum TaxID=3116575 RepID=A0ABU7LN95_9PROT|nr:class III extradiol ring-cleavage dioxygenase [Hyphobacterium sp. HN65]MEE2525393.1 class III extradiol ring-cleavage dioxygenase [Hyphobacterium sp. HN65]
MNYPILFLSHGAPSLLTGQSDAKAFLSALGAELDPPKAWIIVSAHWQQSPIGVTASAAPRTIHDFRGFGDDLARFEYAAPGNPALARQIVEALNAAGLAAREDPDRGFDHGVWVPMALITPRAAHPVIQVSLPAPDANGDQLTRLGETLGRFAEDGHRVIFSGSLTHSLQDSIGAPENAPVLEEADIFAGTIRQALLAGDREALANWHTLPFAHRNHPTPEHFEPLIAAEAAGHSPHQLHQSWTHGALAMDVWSFRPH